MNIFDFASRATPLHSVPASNAVKSNMAANAEFQDLAASRGSKRRHFENTNLLAGNNHVINIFTSEDMRNIHCVLYNKW